MLSDYHIHTNYSGDSSELMENYILKAIKQGFSEICFTDHIDYGSTPNFNCDIVPYFKDIKILQEKYQNKLNIKFGMEFGIQEYCVEHFKNLFKNYPFDFIILSFHLIDDEDLYFRTFQKNKTQKEYNERYYNEIKNTIKIYDNYSVLGHLDLIRRYDDMGEYPFCYTKDIIEEILKHIISKNKGIELNTSSFRYKLKDLMPSKDILKLYKKLGGEIITLGSDSHNITHFGYKIKEMQEYLQSIGYKYFCTFNKMEPIFHKL